MANQDSYTIGEIEDKQIMERKLHVVDGPLLPLGSKSYAPTAIVAMWTRTRNNPWQLVSLSMEGERVVRDETGAPERRPHEHVTHRFERVNWAPKWAQGAANSHRPSQSGEARPRT